MVDGFCYCCVFQACNQVANILARLALDNGYDIWMEDPPNFLVPILNFDVLN